MNNDSAAIGSPKCTVITVIATTYAGSVFPALGINIAAPHGESPSAATFVIVPFILFRSMSAADACRSEPSVCPDTATIYSYRAAIIPVATTDACCTAVGLDLSTIDIQFKPALKVVMYSTNASLCNMIICIGIDVTTMYKEFAVKGTGYRSIFYP